MDNSNNILLLRKLNKNDEDLLFNWANDPLVRSLSFNKDPITLDEHRSWFKKKYEDSDIIMWILEVDSSPSGLVRFEKNYKEVILNYLIAPLARGKGLASKMLIMAMNEISKYWKNVRILAYTLPENIASIKSLERTGFYLHSTGSGRNCYVFNGSE